MKPLLRLLLAVTLAAPLTCQSEVDPYFALSTNKTFGTFEEPSVNLTGINVQSVEMRVYRINNPLQFFTQLEDTHTFGGVTPRRPGKRSFLETLHDWKRSLRREIRYDLRSQFTEPPSAHFHNPFANSGAAPKETYFAPAPVLNQEQLVLSFRQPVASNDRWSSSPVPIRVKEKGVFLVEAVRGNLRAFTILTVSDTVLITKVGRTQMLAFVADRETGEPKSGVKLSQIDPHGLTTTSETDANGLADLALPKSSQAENLRLLAINGRDVAFNDVPNYFLSRNQTDNWIGYVYTDRPVYRPGDPMHFRGILRLQAMVGYQVPTSRAVNVEITDPDGKTIFHKSLTTNANGIVHDEFRLEKTAALGNYYIQVHGGQSAMSGNFEVQEYKKPEYEVHVTLDKPRILEGESTSAVIDSKYYFGEPVNGAKVHYSIYRSRYWFPFWYEPGEEVEEDDGSEGGGMQAYEDANSEEVSQGDGALDSDGKLTIEVPTTVSDNRLDYRYTIEAGVTDKAGREINGTGTLIATFGTFNVSVESTTYVATPGKTVTFKVATRDYDNKPVSATVHLVMGTWDWRTRTFNASSTRADVTTSQDGTTETDLSVPNAGGEYQIIATAKAGPRTVEGTTYLWAPGNGFEWGEGNQRTVQIIADKKTYKAGDKARLLLITGQPNTPVLVTIEGRDLRSHQLIRSTGATAEFEYTVTTDDEPGFFVSAQFLRHGQLFQSQKRISVPPEDHKLDIKVTTDKPQYLPGQTATYTLAAFTPEGKPLANADLSLGVVDEAIYAIRKDTTPDILNFFYGREYDAVNTQNSLNFYFNGEAGTRRMRMAELRGPSKLAQLKPEQLVKPKIRKIFPDTAFWSADVTTDSSGKATTQVPFPDSLTTWRATIRGVAPDDRFGSQTSKIIVRKNLIMRLAVPRFFVQGDEVVISGIVHNYLQDNKRAHISVTLEGLELIGDSTTQELDIAPRTEAKVDWRVKAKQLRQAKITGQALTNEESDALELTLPINPPGVPLHDGHSGSIANSGSASVTLTFPSAAVVGSRSLSIRLSPSVAGSIFGALQYLTAFPYGCVEQTMSSFLPDIMVQKSMKELDLKQPLDQADLDAKIQAGLDRLYSFQHHDGGWGWWQTDETHPFMSAYVVAGLSEAKADGIKVNTASLQRGAESVERQLGNGKDLEPDLRAYMALSLIMAGKNEANALNSLYDSRKKLSPYGEALLGLSLNSLKDSRAAALASHLESEAKADGDEVSWPATRDAMLDFETDVTPEATAYVMKFLSRQTPQSSILPKAALWLVNHRNEGYWWSSTKQTAMVIYGLIDYLKATNELHPDLSATVTVNGQSLDTQKFDSLNGGPEITLDEAKLQTAANQIQVSSSGKGRLYYSVTATHYSNEARLEKNGAVALNILRDYFRLAPVKQGDHIVYDLSPLDGSVAQGDTIAVRLTVTGSDWKYLLMEDPIPAGTEFIERDSLYQINNKPPWWRYWFSRRELHDDRMAIFQTFFNEGQQQYFYLLKVVNPGLFQVSPARVQPMYQPGHLATTEARTLEIK